MNITRLENRAILIADQGMSLREAGKMPDDVIGKVSVPLDNVEQWSEIPIEEVESAMTAARRERAYKERVEALIAERYSLRDEMAINRQRDSKPEEFAAYNAYAEHCKRRARTEMNNQTNTL